MKLHLPVRLFKSVLACLTAVASFSLGSGVAWAEAQNLTFSGSSLTWDTSAENKSFVDEEDAAASFAAGDNVSFTGESTVTLGENITAGTLDIATGADVTIDLKEYTLHTDTISLSGTLAVGNSLSIASGSTLAVQNDTAVLDSALVLGEKSGLVVESAASLNNNSLTLQGGSNLILTAAGDGKTYTLFSGISSLLDKNGDTLAAAFYSINDYFDKSAPGSGFWADTTLVLAVDGTLQLVRHNEIVKDALDVTTRQTGSVNYSYYAGISFKNLTTTDSSGSAIYGEYRSTISLSDNGSVTFSGNSASYDGSAIYGDSSSTISLSDNGSVTFTGNTASWGGAIYGGSDSTITLSNNGSVTFSGNSASVDGGAIYTYDSVTMSDNGSVTFSGNSASYDGGAIDGGSDSTITLSNNGSVTFSGNTATFNGGAIRGGGDITLSSNSSVEFSGNSASYDGGAIYGYSSSTISLSDNGSVTFSGNSASDSGAIYADGSVTMSGNGSVTFSGNSASYDGGAIYGYSSSTISLSDNGSVTFSGNSAAARYYASGGAIYGGSDSTITLSNNGSVTFSGNTASRGGAIYADGSVTMSGNGSVTFSGNSASDDGGAIYGLGGDIVLSDNGSMTFSGNSASDDGGAIYGGENSTIKLSNNGSVTFSGNSASDDGGAIYGYYSSTISLSDNGSVTFSGNTASSGGAIYGYSSSTISLSDNGSVTFSGNKASDYGGAIYGYVDSTITLSNNGSVTFTGNTASSWGGAIYTYGSVTMTDNGSVTFSGNSASSWGGAIYGFHDITLSNNGSVTFSGNTASSSGGAIYGESSITLSNNSSVEFSGNSASGDYARGGAIYTEGSLHICNNDSAEFAGNAERIGSAYRLRSVYANSWEKTVELSAAAGKSVTFYDSIYVGENATVNLNADYEDAEGNIIEQKGDIVFTGATTEDDLYKAKGNVAGTEEEIRLSRTTEVNAMTNLYGGRLRIEDGAIYQGYGITAHEGSEATVRVKDATLSHTGYDLIFNAGTTLHAAGVSSITGNVVMLQGSQLALTVGAVNGESAVLTLGTAMDSQGVNLLVEGAEYLLSGEYKLIYNAGYDAADWMSVSGCAAESLVCKNGMLTLTCSNAGNKAVENGSVVGNTTGNMVVANGAAVTIAGAIAADAETGAAGHLIINNGHAELVEGGCMDGHVVFANAGSGATRELTVATDASVDAVVLSGSADGTVAVETGHEFAAGTLEGKGSLVKTGGGTMTHDGEDSTVQGRVEIREGCFENTGNLVASQIEVSGGHLENQGTISHVELNAGKLSGGGVFCGLTMKGGVLVIGNSPGFQQYTGDLIAVGGELVFSVSGLENAATAESESWVSETYSQIDMGGYELSLGDDTTLTIALGGSLLENLEGEFNMQLFDNVGNIESFTHGMLTLMLENTRFVVTTEAEGLCGDWEAGADLSLWVHGVQYRVADSGIVLSGRFGAIPEPTTTTLSLLALAALAARRRRK